MSTELQVVPVQGRNLVSYWPEKKSDGSTNYGPKFLKRAMPWFEEYWHNKRRYPDTEDIMAYFGASLEQVQDLNTHRFWLQALDRRGIARPGYSLEVLSDKQIAAITLLTNFSLLEPVDEKMASIGVSEEMLNGWYQNPHFVQAIQNRTERVLDNVSSDATVGLARKIKEGNFQAIKFYYDITGRSQSPEAVNLKRATQILIEAVQKHVKDPAVLDAIGNEVQGMMKIEGLQ